MKILNLCLGPILVSIVLCLSANAQGNEERCQINKLRAMGEYIECRHGALFIEPISARRPAISLCKSTFTREWNKIISGTSKAGAVCLDIPLTSSDFDVFVVDRINALATLLGNRSKSREPVQLFCRKTKSLEAGRYASCRLAAEAVLVTSDSTTQYDTDLHKCEVRFSRRWKKVISDTKRRVAVCLDSKQPISVYKLLIDAYTRKVAAILAGKEGFAEPTATSTPSPSPTSTFTITATVTATISPTPSPTSMATAAPSATSTPTLTATPTSTNTPTATTTATPTVTVTPTSVCGDSIVSGIEECDDGNLSDSDACLSSCVVASCGEGYVYTGVEDCDDGNLSNTDACLNNCTASSCGDGFVYSGLESCDDGNLLNSDACLSSCVVASCGDGFVFSGVEDCDDGNLNDSDSCRNDCSTP